MIYEIISYADNHPQVTIQRIGDPSETLVLDFSLYDANGYYLTRITSRLVSVDWTSTTATLHLDNGHVVIIDLATLTVIG